MNTKKKGDITVLAVMQAALRRGLFIAIPFGDSDRYDLIFDSGNKLDRIQCKTGKLIDERFVRFSTSSSDWRNGKKRKYAGEVDFFGVFCPQLKSTYLIPIERCDANFKVLWLTAPKNRQTACVLMARDFEF